MNTFSFATMMIAIAALALLAFISKLGYWPCVAACTVACALAMTAIPSLFRGCPRSVFVIVGAISAVVGYWGGLSAAVPHVHEPTVWLTNLEYQQAFYTQLFFYVLSLLVAFAVGGMIGFGMYSMATLHRGRDREELESRL